MASVIQKITIPVPRELFFRVISDYHAYPDFLSTVSSAEVIERTKTKAKVDFAANVVKPIRYRLELTEKNPSSLSWKLIDGDFMRKNEGKWTLKALDKNETEATYEIEVEISRLVPSFVTGLLVKESLPKTLEQFRDRAVAISKKMSKPSRRRTSGR